MEETERTPASTEICPNGHTLLATQIVMRDGYKTCPVCEQQARWAAPGWLRSMRWSRQLLRVPLVLAAIGMAFAAIESGFDISTSADFVGGNLPGSTAELLSSIFEALSWAALAAATGWIAYIVGLDDTKS